MPLHALLQRKIRKIENVTTKNKHKENDHEKITCHDGNDGSHRFLHVQDVHPACSAMNQPLNLVTLTHIPKEDVARLRKEILSTTDQELKALLPVMEAYVKEGKFCAVGDKGMTDAIGQA